MSEAFWLLAGVFAGAWLWHRATRGASPLPSLPARQAKPEKKPLSTVSGV